MNDELSHHGVKGMRWGIRRYQNKDGSLTPEGRRRLGSDKYEDAHNEDIVLKKGTKASRVVSTWRYEEFSDPEVGGSPEKGKKYLKDTLEKDKNLPDKYLNVDGIRNSGRMNGKDYYTLWFTDEGYIPSAAQITMYTLKKDAKIASGKKVVDELVKEYGSEKIKKTIKNNQHSGSGFKSMTLDYTKDKDLFNKVNKKFKDMGYDGVEDINDRDTDMPIILFDSTNKLIRDDNIQTGKEAIDDLIKRIRNEEVKK